MRWLFNLDEQSRIWTQNALFWMGGRYGVTRAQVTRNTGILMTLLPAIVLADFSSKNPISSAFGILMSVLVNGYFAVSANIRGNALLRQNEAWGAYTNWREWRWLRLITLYLLPIDTITTVAQASDGMWFMIGILLKDFVTLIMFYSITINELPPRKPRAVTVPVRSHVGTR